MLLSTPKHSGALMRAHEYKSMALMSTHENVAVSTNKSYGVMATYSCVLLGATECYYVILSIR